MDMCIWETLSTAFSQFWIIKSICIYYAFFILVPVLIKKYAHSAYIYNLDTKCRKSLQEVIFSLKSNIRISVLIVTESEI